MFKTKILPQSNATKISQNNNEQNSNNKIINKAYLNEIQIQDKIKVPLLPWIKMLWQRPMTHPVKNLEKRQ